MGIKDFFLRKMLEKKLQGVPEAQREILLSAMEKNPEFFKRVGDEVKKRVKRGESELVATLAVMRENQAELQKIMRES